MTGKKVGMMSLGCAKNLVDSEVMLGNLRKEGYQLTPDVEDADVVIVNTCGFIDSAKEESIDAILEMAEHRKSGKLEKLIVTGCLSQRYHETMEKDLPEVDLFLGTGHPGDITDFLSGKRVERWDPDFLYTAESNRVLTTPSHSAYLKISEGCNHTCSFCIIPDLRGKHRSRSIDDIVTEAVNLGAQGVCELNLVAQDSTYYGRDLGLKDGLAMLLEKLVEVETIHWIRVHYMYPHQVSKKLLDILASHPKLCSYLDIPLQHASKNILTSMRRGGDHQSYAGFLDQVRGAIPSAFLRSSFIVGYPGETDRDFQELISFVKDQQFNYLGVFSYSHEEGTTAYQLDNDVPQECKEERLHELMSLQRDISQKKCAELKGKTLDVLIEGVHPETELLLRGRHQGQAPDVDGEVFVTEGIYKPGDIVPVTIEETYEYDVAGRVIGGINV